MQILKESFFPVPSASECVPDNEEYPELVFKFKLLTEVQIEKAIQRLKPFKALGPSGIPNMLLKKCSCQLVPVMLPLFNATFNLNYYLERWKLSTTVVLRKLEKPDYMLAKAYHPITLLETIVKVLSSCMASVLQFHTAKEGLLPNTHFGRRPGRLAVDALQMMVSFIKDSWRRKEVVTALYLDVKGAFPSISIDRLIHNMWKRGIPKEYTNWMGAKLKERRMVLSFDDFISAVHVINDGCDQGDLLSALYYLFYNTGLAGVAEGRK